MSYPKPRSLKELAEAFEIFARYARHIPLNGIESTEALWGTIDGDVCIDVDGDKVSVEDKKRLMELGWTDDEDCTFLFKSDLRWIQND